MIRVFRDIANLFSVLLVSYVLRSGASDMMFLEILLILSSVGILCIAEWCIRWRQMSSFDQRGHLFILRYSNLLSVCVFLCVTYLLYCIVMSAH